MAELESSTSNPDVRDTTNCVNTAMAKPGQEIRLLVCLEANATVTKLKDAVGTLSNDGKSFSIVVTKEDGGQETHDLCYRDLLKALSDLD